MVETAVRFQRVLGAAIMAFVLLSGTAAVARAAGPAGPTPSQEPPSSFRIGGLQEPDSMNPFVGVLSASYAVYARVYDLLVGIGPDLTPVPQLARTWSVSQDGLAWTFELQPNVVWHDDTPATPRPFTSADVKFTFEYIQSCGLSLFLGYVGDPSDPNAVYISSIDTPDDLTVVVHTNSPKANMLSLFVPILPQHIWSAVGCNQAKQGYKNEPPIGTGIYKFVEWRRGQFLRLALNDRYFFLQAGQDYVDEIVLLYYNSATSLYNDLVAGRLDATGDLTPRQFLSLPGDIDSLSPANPDADPDVDISKFVLDSISLAELGYCSADDALIAEYGVSGDRHWLALNLTIRQAVANAINKTKLIDTIWSGTDALTGQTQSLARAGSSLIPPATPFWHYNVTAQEDLTFSLVQAAARLGDPAGDGYTTTDGLAPNLLGSNLASAAANNRDAFGDIDGDGVRDVLDMAYVQAQNPGIAPQANRAVRGSEADRLFFGIWVINTDQEAIDASDIFLPDLASIGIGLEKKVVSGGQQLSASYACDYDLYMWGWGFDVDPDFGLSVMTKDQILGWQDAWYANATYDAWYLEQQRKVDLYERQAIVHDMQKLLYRDQPYNIMWYPQDATVVRSDRFTNWGDWERHPGLGLTGYGNAYLMLQLRPLVGAANQCPTNVEVGATEQPRIVFVDEDAAFVGTALDGEGDPLNWTWDWADGTLTQVDTPSGDTDVTVTHAWTAEGDYNITVTVTDNLCGDSTTSAPVWVRVVTPPILVGWIAGTVTDAATTAAIGGATIGVAPGGRATVTAADGTYNVSVDPGSYNVTASRLLYASQTKPATVGLVATTTVDFALAANRGWIFGTVTDATTGARLEGVALLAAGPGGTQFPISTNATGQYNVTVPPGTYTVRIVQAVGYINQTRTDIAVANDAAVQVDFALAPIPRPTGLGPLAIATIGILAVVVIAAIAYAMLRRRKREALPPPPPTAGPPAGGTPPPEPPPPPPP